MEENIIKLYEDGYLKIKLDPDDIAYVVKHANKMRRENGTGPDNLTAKNVGPRPEKRLGIDRIAELKTYTKEYNTQGYKDFLKDNHVSKLDRDWLIHLHMFEKPHQIKHFSDFIKKLTGNKTVKRSVSKRPVIIKRSSNRKSSRSLRTKSLMSSQASRAQTARARTARTTRARTTRNTRARTYRNSQTTRMRGHTQYDAPVYALAPAALAPAQTNAVAPAPVGPTVIPPTAIPPTAIPPTANPSVRPDDTFIKFHSPGQGDSPTTRDLRTAYQRKTAEADPTIQALRGKIHADGTYSPETAKDLAARTATVLATDANSRGLNTVLRSRAASKTAAVLRSDRTALATPVAQAGLSPVTRDLIGRTAASSPVR